MKYENIGTAQITLLALGAAVMIIIPVLIAIFWVVIKKEKITTVLVGAAVFLVFALILEKPIQNILVFPTQMGLGEHIISRYINSKPVLWAFIVGLFPGLFEETGRFVAFKTVLRNRKNRETSVSYGIGHSGCEVVFILGMTYVTYIIYAVMINLGMFGLVTDQVALHAPEQMNSINALVAQISDFSFYDLGLAVIERIFAVILHIGLSILVFYAARDIKKLWLYPLSVLLHTLADFIFGLNMAGVIRISTVGLEVIFAFFGIIIFCSAYFLLYRKDSNRNIINN